MIRRSVIVLALFFASVHPEAGMFSEEFGHRRPPNLMKELRSPDGKSSVALFRGKVTEEYGTPEHFHLSLCQDGVCRWFSTPRDLFVEVDNLHFVDNRSLVFTGSTETWMASYLIDVESGKVTALGQGHATYLRQGKNAGLFLLRGMKGYVMDELGASKGAYWSNILVDREGNLVEVLSLKGSDTCYPLRFLLDPKGHYPRLRQSFDAKVCVEQ